MTDREKYLTILDRFYRGRGASLLTKDESEALDYAISSIKTDLKYDLLYEETKHIADADKKIEPTPNDCETCIHNKGVLECDMYGCKYEPTTKNDLGVDCIDRAQAQTEIEMNAYRYTLAKEHGGIGEVEWNNHLIAIDDAVDIIRNLPSVTPQPRKGEWLRMSDLSEQEDDRYKCSRCGNVVHYKSKMDLYTFNSWCGRCGCDNDWRKCIEGN